MHTFPAVEKSDLEMSRDRGSDSWSTRPSDSASLCRAREKSTSPPLRGEIVLFAVKYLNYLSWINFFGKEELSLMLSLVICLKMVYFPASYGNGGRNIGSLYRIARPFMVMASITLRVHIICRSPNFVQSHFSRQIV